MAARPLGTRVQPALLRENPEMPTHSGLRQLHDLTDLPHRVLGRFQKEKDARAGLVGERLKPIQDGRDRGSGR